MNEKLIDDTNRAIKTGNALKYLANLEIKEGYNFSETDLIRTTKECNTNTLTRNELNFNKELLLNSEYCTLQEKISSMCDGLKYIEDNDKEKFKDDLLEVVLKRDKLYRSIENKYNI